MKVYICPICGNVVELIGNKHGVLVCCGKPMEELTANTSGGAKEKHVPVIEKKEERTMVIQTCENYMNKNKGMNRKDIGLFI